MRTVAAQTQTPGGRVPPLRSPLMPCMRPRQPPVGAPAASKVGLELRREAALRKQLVAARRRRLEAVVSGTSPDDAPIAPVTARAPHAARLDTASAGAASACAASAAGESVAGAERRLAAAGLDEAEAALAIAQRFLGSSLGGHFTDAAAGEARPRPFSFREPATRPPPATYVGAVGGRGAAGVRVAGAAASAAAAMVGGRAEDDEVAGGDDARDAVGEFYGDFYGDGGGLSYGDGDGDGDGLSHGDGDGLSHGDGDGDDDELIASAPRHAFEPSTMLLPRSLDAVEVSHARYGLHEPQTLFAHDREAARHAPLAPHASAAEDGDSAPAWMPSDLSTATMSCAAAASRAPSRPEGGTRATAWEVDVSALRGPAPPLEQEPRRVAAPPRPSPASGRRTHAGWACEFVM
jgi:hypothetical protein